MTSPTTTGPVAIPIRAAILKLWMGIVLIERLHRIQNSQSGMDRSFRIVFVGLGISKIDQHPITHVFGDIAIEPTNGLATGV